MASTFLTSQVPKVVHTRGAFNILTSRCASHHNGMHFFDILTSKSGLHLVHVVCLVHVDFKMCFTPPWHALFRHLNFQKWSEHGVLCLTSQCASHPNKVHFFHISTSNTSTSGPNLVCFVHFDFVHFFNSQLGRSQVEV